MDIKGKIANIVIIILSIVLVFNAIILATKWSYVADRGNISEYDLLSTLDYGNYGQFLRLVYENDQNEENTQIYTECRAIAKYYEATSLYKVYRTMGDEERAKRYEEEMEDAESKLGDFYFFKEEILTRFEMDGLENN